MKFIVVAVLTLNISLHVPSVAADALEKITPERLEAVRLSTISLQSQRVEIPRDGPYQEHRANLHVHSHWSHDSVGTIEEITAAAKKVGTSVLMFTEHPADHYDFFVDGHQGMRDGVLLIPGAEMEGFLVYPRMSHRGVKTKSAQELSDLIRSRDGQLFVSHLEERMDWQIQGITGVEIYNTHAEFKQETGMISALKNPFRMISIATLIQKYPQESFAALQKYPADYLKRWDELCAIAPHTGISANDAHQNVGFAIRWTEGNQGQVEDAQGKKLLEISLAGLPDRETLLQNRKPGDIIFDLYLDRYENSLRHVGTHLLLKEHTEAAVRECLDAGRCFVGFDWIADSRGFDFAAVDGTARSEMGSQTRLSPNLKLAAKSPLPVHWRLLKNGVVIAETDGSQLEQSIKEPGIYRCEAWLDVADERTIWILSNPIDIVAQ